MKTPRELLLEQHQQTVPALDRIRRQALRRLEQPAGSEPSGWRSLFTVGRWQLGGLAAAWCLVFLLNASRPTDPAPAAAKALPPSADLMLALREHQRQVRQWIEPAPVAESRPAPGRQSRRQIKLYNA